MTTDTDKYESLLIRILTGIAHRQIVVRPEWIGTRRLSLNCDVHPDDMGLVMGGKGACIKSLQFVFRWIAKAHQMDHIGIFLFSPGDRTTKYNCPKNGWNEASALDLATDLIEATGNEVLHLRIEQNHGCVGLVVQPELPKELAAAVNAVLDSYGKSHGVCFGLAL